MSPGPVPTGSSSTPPRQRPDGAHAGITPDAASAGGEGDDPPESAASSSLTIVANRLPVHMDDSGQWRMSPGGLVRAMTPVLRRFGGTWLGWSGQPDAAGGIIDVDGLHLHDVPLSSDEIARYYIGTANEILWPLFHDAVRSPDYDGDAWDVYRHVNRRFAERTAEATPRGGTVWIHDYHLLLAPGFLRSIRPDLSIGLFLHIPVPPAELFATLPWREEIIDSLTAADLVGTQTEIDAGNLRAAISRPGPSEPIDHSRLRGVTIEAFPISIESGEFRDAALAAQEDGRVAELRQRFGEDRTIFLGVDRLDYTKGIDRRLEAFETALSSGAIDARHACFIQVCVPSRDEASHYPEINARVDRLVGQINGRYGRLGCPVIEYTRESVGLDELIPLYCLADVMVVTPFRDGMNLVAKEFIACRTDGSGELILSEFAGAAQEFPQATIVNPHDVEAVTDALIEAWERHRSGRTPRAATAAMHEQVLAHDIARWARAFIDRLVAVGGTRRPDAPQVETPAP